MVQLLLMMVTVYVQDKVPEDDVNVNRMVVVVLGFCCTCRYDDRGCCYVCNLTPMNLQQF